MLQPEHALDVGATIHARAVGGFRDAQIREFRLPAPQYVRLDLSEIADFLRSEHRAIRDRGGHVEQWREYNRATPADRARMAYFRRVRSRRRTLSRIGVPSNPNASRSRLTRN